MKMAEGWWFPDHEEHLIAWLRNPKASVVMNGRKAYQGKKQQAALAACKSFRCAVDIGGHIGLWSHNMGHAFHTVHAFEPVALHRECFIQNVRQSNVVLHECALGAEVGTVNLTSEHGSSGNTHVTSMDGTIPLRTLDSFELQDVDFIKIDCEGYELNVLRGAHDTITLCQPTIIVEQKRDMAARFGAPLLGAVDYLKGMGYKVVQEISGDYIMVT